MFKVHIIILAMLFCGPLLYAEIFTEKIIRIKHSELVQTTQKVCSVRYGNRHFLSTLVTHKLKEQDLESITPRYLKLITNSLCM